MKYSKHFNIYELSIHIRVDNSLKIKSNKSNIFNFETKEKKIEKNIEIQKESTTKRKEMFIIEIDNLE